MTRLHINTQPNKAGRISRSAFFVSTLCCLLLLNIGCANLSAQNDQLRMENFELKQQVAALTQRSKGLEVALKSAEQDAKQTRKPLPEDLYRSVCTRISLSNFSGGFDANRDKYDDAVRLYLQTWDFNSRFAQTHAAVKVTIRQLPEDSNPDAPDFKPQDDTHYTGDTLVEQNFTPQQFDAAYRSGLTGTNYVLVIPLEKPPRTFTRLAVQIEFDDLITGQQYKTRGIVNFNRQRMTP